MRLKDQKEEPVILNSKKGFKIMQKQEVNIFGEKLRMFLVFLNKRVLWKIHFVLNESRILIISFGNEN